MATLLGRDCEWVTVRPDPHHPQGSGDADGAGQGVVQSLATLPDYGLGHTEWDRSN